MDVQPRMEEIEAKARQAADLYHRLVLLVGPAGSGKSAILRALDERPDKTLLNVNLGLARELLDLTDRARARELPRILEEIVDSHAGGAETVLLDNNELLFDAGLKQDPLRLLQNLARHRTVVAAWPGSAAGGTLTYAVPGHPEYRSYRLEPGGPLVANLEEAA